MPRSPAKPSPTSRLVCRTTSAPRRVLRVVADQSEGGDHTGFAGGAGGSAPPWHARSEAAGAERPHTAFAAACLPHQAELFGVAMRICRDPDAAGDLVQETLMRAMIAWHSFEPGSNLRAWLFRILTNTFINGYRKRRRHQRFAQERPTDALRALYGRDRDHTDTVDEALCEGQLADEVQLALARLGPDYREVVERADLRGEKYKDIADALALPIGTVMSRLFRARRVLETELADYAARDYGIRRAA
jgi:RNA polymerase sigma-70 factor, ECF subfamily